MFSGSTQMGILPYSLWTIYEDYDSSRCYSCNPRAHTTGSSKTDPKPYLIGLLRDQELQDDFIFYLGVYTTTQAVVKLVSAHLAVLPHSVGNFSNAYRLSGSVGFPDVTVPSICMDDTKFIRRNSGLEVISPSPP